MEKVFTRLRTMLRMAKSEGKNGMFARGRGQSTSAYATEKRRRQAIICEYIAQAKNMQIAAQYAGVPYRTVSTWRARDPVFLAMLEQAAELRTQALEQEAWRRAFAGSDRLMEFMLRAARPAVYRETRTLELTGPNGSPLELGDSQRAARILAIVAAADADGDDAGDDDDDNDDDIAEGEFTAVVEPAADGSDLI